MSIARKTTLLVAIALAAMAMAASATSAQETPITIIDEETGHLCNPCTVHIEGESHIRAMPSGVIVSACHDDFFLSAYSNGIGEVDWVGWTHAGPGCTIFNCISGPGDPPDTTIERHWPLSGFGEEGDGTEHVTIRFCFATPTVELHCNGRIRITDAGDHHYVLTTSPSTAFGIICAGGARILEGAWQTESPHDPDDREIEILHSFD